MVFEDRKDAGNKLAKALSKYKGCKDCIVLGLPRGGVVTGYEVSSRLKLPLDIIVPRKIGAPGNEEYAIGAIAESGKPIWDEESLKFTGASEEYKKKVVEEEREEAKRRMKVYRAGRPELDLKGKTAILVDDGVATGSTIRAAVASAKARKAAKVVVAVPVSARDSLNVIKKEADEVVCLYTPMMFAAVGQFYEVFAQTEDDEVIEIMGKK